MWIVTYRLFALISQDATRRSLPKLTSSHFATEQSFGKSYQYAPRICSTLSAYQRVYLAHKDYIQGAMAGLAYLKFLGSAERMISPSQRYNWTNYNKLSQSCQRLLTIG